MMMFKLFLIQFAWGVFVKNAHEHTEQDSMLVRMDVDDAAGIEHLVSQVAKEMAGLSVEQQTPEKPNKWYGMTVRIKLNTELAEIAKSGVDGYVDPKSYTGYFLGGLAKSLVTAANVVGTVDTVVTDKLAKTLISKISTQLATQGLKTGIEGVVAEGKKVEFFIRLLGIYNNEKECAAVDPELITKCSPFKDVQMESIRENVKATLTWERNNITGQVPLSELLAAEKMKGCIVNVPLSQETNKFWVVIKCQRIAILEASLGGGAVGDLAGGAVALLPNFLDVATSHVIADTAIKAIKPLMETKLAENGLKVNVAAEEWKVTYAKGEENMNSDDCGKFWSCRMHSNYDVAKNVTSSVVNNVKAFGNNVANVASSVVDQSECKIVARDDMGERSGTNKFMNKHFEFIKTAEDCQVAANFYGLPYVTSNSADQSDSQVAHQLEGCGFESKDSSSAQELDSEGNVKYPSGLVRFNTHGTALSKLGKTKIKPICQTRLEGNERKDILYEKEEDMVAIRLVVEIKDVDEEKFMAKQAATLRDTIWSNLADKKAGLAKNLGDQQIDASVSVQRCGSWTGIYPPADKGYPGKPCLKDPKKTCETYVKIMENNKCSSPEQELIGKFDDVVDCFNACEKKTLPEGVCEFFAYGEGKCFWEKMTYGSCQDGWLAANYHVYAMEGRGPSNPKNPLAIKPCAPPTEDGKYAPREYVDPNTATDAILQHQ